MDPSTFSFYEYLLKILLGKYCSINLETDIDALCVWDLLYNTRELGSRSRYYYSNRNYNKAIDNGTPPLHFAMSSANLEGVNILLQHGVSASKFNSNKETAMFGLIWLNDKAKISQGLKILIANGVNINQVNAFGCTVLNKGVKH